MSWLPGEPVGKAQYRRKRPWSQKLGSQKRGQKRMRARPSPVSKSPVLKWSAAALIAKNVARHLQPAVRSKTRAYDRFARELKQVKASLPCRKSPLYAKVRVGRQLARNLAIDSSSHLPIIFRPLARNVTITWEDGSQLSSVGMGRREETERLVGPRNEGGDDLLPTNCLWLIADNPLHLFST